MPKITVPNAYIGIDPGVKGSIVALYEQGLERTLAIQVKPLEDATPCGIWSFLSSWQQWCCYAVIEQQAPRPTRWFDKQRGQWQSSVLRSTVILYGSYMQLCGMLTASEMRWEECPPQRWQKELRVKKVGTDYQWKRLLKMRAHQLYPSFSQEVTQATADGLLLAHYAREKSLLRSLSDRCRNEEQE